MWQQLCNHAQYSMSIHHFKLMISHTTYYIVQLFTVVTNDPMRTA